MISLKFPSAPVCAACLCAVFLSAPASAQPAPAQPAETSDKATAYYHFTLAHLYAEMAAAYGNRGEYLTKAIESYKAAMKADPSANFMADELSDLYFQAGRIREAVTESEEAIRQNPSDLNARRILGRMYTRMIGDQKEAKVNEDMLKKAIEQYSKIAEAQPSDTESLLTLGRLYKVAQNSVEAEKAYKKILEVDPDNEEALTGLAVVYGDLGDTKRSAELLQQVSSKSPSVRTLTALAAQYEQMRDHGLAAETLKKALELAPENPDLKRAYAQNLLMADRYDEALGIYNELAAQDKKDTQSLLRISQIYRQKGDFAQAREAAARALAIDPNSLELQYNPVTLLEAEGKTAEAIAALKSLMETSAKRSYSTGERANRVVLLERLGLLYRNNEQYTEAIDTFRQIAAADPALAARASAQIADSYRVAKQYTKALEETDAALKKFPDDRVLKAVRASLLAETGRSGEAIAELKTMLDGKNDRETWITIAQIHEKAKNYPEMAKAIDAADKLSESADDKESIAFMRGAMFEKMKNFDAAEAEFRKVIAANPKNASALNYLGYMLADRNVRVPEALEMIRKAVEMEPNNGAYLDSLGWAYFRMGDLDKAEEYLQRAVERTAKDPTVHDHLGDVYLRQGKVKEAIAQWQVSLQEWENSSAAEKDPAEIAKVQKKLEGARVRLARESGGTAPKQP